MRVVVWLDDTRDPNYSKWAELIDVIAEEPDRVIWAKDYKSFLIVVRLILEDIEAWKLVGLFFDNDLGSPGGKEGRHAFTWFDEYARANDVEPIELYAQTANPAAKRELRAGFQSLKRHWSKTTSEE